MKFCMHLSTRIQDKRYELPLINCLTDLALEADVSGYSAISLTEHHLHENQGYQNSLLFASALAPRLKQATLILATVNPAIHHPVRLVESCNLIDQLNEGRLVVVFGSGFKDTDLVAFGRDLAQRNALVRAGDPHGPRHLGLRRHRRTARVRGRRRSRTARRRCEPVVVPQAAPHPGTRNRDESRSDCRCRRARMAAVHGDQRPRQALASRWPAIMRHLRPPATTRRRSGSPRNGRGWARRCTWQRPTNRPGRRPMPFSRKTRAARLPATPMT